MKDRHQVLFTQLKTYRLGTLHTINDVTEASADVIPPSFNNNIRWNLGHIYLDQYLWIKALTNEMPDIPDAFHSWFGYGTSPAVFTDETPTLATLKKLLEQQPDIIQEHYGSRLEDIYPATEMGMNTIEQVLIRTIFHEGIHLQSILFLKRALKAYS